MLKDIDAYVELEAPLPFAGGPKRAFLLDVKNVTKRNQLDLELGPVYSKNTSHYERPKPLDVLVRAEGWGLCGAEDVAAFVMADGHALLVDLKPWRELWRDGWRHVYGDVGEDRERLELLGRIQALSDVDLRNLGRYKAGQMQYEFCKDDADACDKFLNLGGDVDAARSMEIAGYVHTKLSASKQMWIASYAEATLREKGLILLTLDAPLEEQNQTTVDARLLLSRAWPSYEAWEAYVEAIVDGQEPTLPASRSPGVTLPDKPRPVVYFDAHGREAKDLSPEAWALRRAGLPALAELSDVLFPKRPSHDGAPKGLLPSDLRKLDGHLPEPLRFNVPGRLEAVAELLRQRHLIVAGHWLEPRGHAAWQLLR